MSTPALSEDQKRELRDLKSRADGYLSQCAVRRLAHYGLGVTAASCSVIVAATSVVVHREWHEQLLSMMRVGFSLAAAVFAMLVTFLKPTQISALVRYALGIAAIACSITVATVPSLIAAGTPGEPQPLTMRMIWSLAAAVLVGFITFLKPLEKASQYLGAWRVLHDAHIDYGSNPAAISGIWEKKREAAEIIERIHSA